MFNLEDLREQKLNQFSDVLDEFSVLITRCRLVSGDDNEGLNAVIEQTKTMRLNTINAINSIETVKSMLAFQIKPDDVEFMKSLFNDYK